MFVKSPKENFCKASKKLPCIEAAKNGMLIIIRLRLIIFISFIINSLKLATSGPPNSYIPRFAWPNTPFTATEAISSTYTGWNLVSAPTNGITGDSFAIVANLLKN